ncbi:hypothetical protein GJ496_007783 [Pomphorhynchus laevis]|nr:hypothetical protein GJ496_007783 [Pomphorhynchus laevis]
MGNACGKKTIEEKYLLLDDDATALSKKTGKSESEIYKFYAGFLVDCPNGYLSEKQLRKVFKSFHPNGNPKRFCRSIFLAMDSNRDNSISFFEFFSVYAVLLSDDIREQLALIFEIFDLDKNGLLSESEISKVLRALYELKNSEDPSNITNAATKANQMMIRMQKYHDHMVSEKEFIDCFINDEELVRLLSAENDNIQ